MPTFIFTHKIWVRIFIFLLANACVIPSAIAAGNLPEKKPMNIIYVLTDDQRYDELGFMNPVLDTPNMDELAKKGVHFKNSFVTTITSSRYIWSS